MQGRRGNRWTIFFQVIFESVSIATVGGIAGFIASFGVTHLLTILAPIRNTPVIIPNSVGIALMCSAVVGVLAGLFRAIKAARLTPVEALRFE